MILSNILSSMRIELQDITEGTQIYQEDELVRAVEKSVSLMSRLIPKRNILETTIVKTITGEILTIASSTGTLAYKPIKKDTVQITGKQVDVDFRINYITGVVTEIGSNLPDTTYTVSYELDSGMLDLSPLLTDYIRLERVEYPAGGSPPSLLTFDQYGNLLVFRGTTSLSENEHLRVVYLEKWTPPTKDAIGNYPSHLNDAVIIGGVGQVLIFKAEKYTQKSVSQVDTVVQILAGLLSLTLTPPSLVPPIVPTLAFPTPPVSPTLDALTPPTPPTLDVLTPPGTITISDITPPTPPTIGEPTAPTDYTFSKPSSPTLPTAPTAPTPPTLSFTAAELALTAVATEIAVAKAYLDSGDDLINAATRGEDVALNFGRYAEIYFASPARRVDEAIARLRQIEETINLYASQVTSYGSAVNAYANNVSGVIGKYREDINDELAGIQDFQAKLNKYQAMVSYQAQKINLFNQEVANYQAQINEESMKIGKYTQDIQSYQAQVTEQQLALTKYGEQLNSYTAEINEQALKISLYQQQINAYQAEVAKEASKITLYQAEIQAFQAQVTEFQDDINTYNAKMNNIIGYASQANNQITNYLNIAGRFLASGQAKINEMITMLGLKPEFATQKASPEQRA